MPSPPRELEKPMAGTIGSDLDHRPDFPVYRRAYRCDAKGASHSPIRLIHADDLKTKVLQKAASEVREYPQTLSLWAFRLAQHVRRGTYGYSEAWETLELAALGAGLSQSQVTRVLYRGFADSMRRRAELMPLSVLRSGVH